jgi:hypothetical protein
MIVIKVRPAGIHPDGAGTGLIISHGVFLHRDAFTRHVETTASRRRKHLLAAHPRLNEPTAIPVLMTASTASSS